MKTVGIICEYNPFHKGHLYQIQQTKKLCEADLVVAVMSGSFVQRGECAFCDKWARAKMALFCGVDLVVELPVVYSSQSAEFFAQGAVKILNEIGVDYISFGVENDNIEDLKSAAQFLLEEPPKYKKELSKALDTGMSFPAAREAAAAACHVKGVLSTPNNILAVEYLKALFKIGSKIEPVAVLRKGSEHDGVGSASYIRKAGIDNAKEYLPKKAYDIIMEEIQKGAAPVRPSAMDSIIVSRLRLMEALEIANIVDVGEGLENRIKEGARLYSTVWDIADYVKTKRYTHSRIRRIMINSLLGITQDHVTADPEYIRVLGMNKKGMEVLRKIKKKGSLPIITKTADAKSSPMLKLDLKATDIYSLAYPNPALRKGGLDFIKSPVVIE